MSKVAKRAGQRHKATSRGAPAGQPVTRFEQQAFEKIYRLVLRIPRGRVMTYGQIARLLEERYSPRLVGWAMHATPHDGRNIPWHRVINSRGGISTGRVILTEPNVQRLMLEAEGVAFNASGHCELSVYQWSPRQRAARAKLDALRANRIGARSTTSVKSKVKKSGTANKKREKKDRTNGNHS
jgi:methylated-DNA-protein-cysteine methyltransferase-like protein